MSADLSLLQTKHGDDTNTQKFTSLSREFQILKAYKTELNAIELSQEEVFALKTLRVLSFSSAFTVCVVAIGLKFLLHVKKTGVCSESHFPNLVFLAYSKLY